MATSAFAQADTNNDQRVDLNEFRNFISGNAGSAGGALYGSSAYSSGTDLGGLAGGYGGSSYESSSSYSSQGGLGGLIAGGADLSLAGAGGGLGSGAGSSSHYESSYSSTADASGLGLAGTSGLAGASGLVGTSGLTGIDGLAGAYGTDASVASGTALSGVSGLTQETTVQRWATDAQGLFQDSNPQVIRRPAPQGVQTYTQNIRVRFLQPPPIPPPGPLIIKEVRPPQPPAPPPLVIRQRAPAPPQPPPLVLRERPPPVPASVASQTVVRRLAALPVPPRSVIIERLPALPAKPRDIIIERWVPYGAQQRRRTIVQRAAAAQQYRAPRNVIIQYEAPQVRIVRQFQRLGVTPENPVAYVQRYGASLRESVTLVKEARAAGVVEDISPPVVAGSFAATEGQFSATGGALGAGGLSGAGVGGVAGELAFEASAGGVGAGYASSSSYESSTGGVVGLESPAAGVSGVGSFGQGATGFGTASSYESSYSASTGDTSGLGLSGLALGGGAGGFSNFESSLHSSGGHGAADAAFAAADTNRDGFLSQQEFRAAGY